MHAHQPMKKTTGPVLYYGDTHGRFQQIIDACDRCNPLAVVLLGDMEPQRLLDIELAPIAQRNIPIWFIHGNHDADSDELWERVWGSAVADRNFHRRVSCPTASGWRAWGVSSEAACGTHSRGRRRTSMSRNSAGGKRMPGRRHHADTGTALGRREGLASHLSRGR